MLRKLFIVSHMTRDFKNSLVSVSLHFFVQTNKESHMWHFFSTIKDKLSKLGLEIKDTFLNIELKGCHFHLSWWIWIFVMDNGHRTRFSNSSEFTTFIQCAIGMAFSPLVWFQDGLDIYVWLGGKTSMKYCTFLAKFIFWINLDS